MNPDGEDMQATEEITIRRAAEADAETLCALLSAMSWELGYAEAFRCDAAALRRHGFGEAPLFHAVLAEQAGRALGMAVYFPEFSSVRGRPGVYVQDLFLTAEARGLGLGRRLLGAVIREAAAWEASYLRLAAYEGNWNALAFYARLGFQSDPRERILWAEGAAFDRLGGTA